jgi:hypothetical protein
MSHAEPLEKACPFGRGKEGKDLDRSEFGLTVVSGYLSTEDEDLIEPKFLRAPRPDPIEQALARIATEITLRRQRCEKTWRS